MESTQCLVGPTSCWWVLCPDCCPLSFSHPLSRAGHLSTERVRKEGGLLVSCMTGEARFTHTLSLLFIGEIMGPGGSLLTLICDVLGRGAVMCTKWNSFSYSLLCMHSQNLLLQQCWNFPTALESHKGTLNCGWSSEVMFSEDDGRTLLFHHFADITFLHQMHTVLDKIIISKSPPPFLWPRGGYGLTSLLPDFGFCHETCFDCWDVPVVMLSEF